MWSLSVELQFYLFVPFLVFFLHRVSTFIQLFSISTLLIASFTIQLNLTNNYEHMALEGRIWQFMLGFMAYYLSSNQAKTVEDGSSITSKLKRIVNFSITFLLIISTLISLSSHKQMNRLLASILSFIIIARPGQSPLLNNFFLIFLGDISYSIYLIHWPLFEWYKYVDVGLFEFEGGTTLMGGISLLIVFVIFGQLVEELFKHLNAQLKSWKMLISILLTFYLLIFIIMQLLTANSINIKFNKRKTHLNNPEWVLQKALHFYNNFESPEKIDKMDSIKWTDRFGKAAVIHPWYCDSTEVPTNFKNRTLMGRLAASACVVRRNESQQNKTIVVVGNSHARMLFPGILHHFKDLFTEATLMNRNGCQFVGTLPEDNEARVCSKERKSLIPMLKEWKRPIDIIIFAMAYTPIVDPPLDPNIKIQDDQIFKEMQQFYSDLAQLAREVLFVPILHFSNGLKTYISVLQRKLLLKQSLGVFRTPLHYAMTHRLNTRIRTENVECVKCLKYDLADLWCRKSEGICDSVDQERRIGFFVDAYHINLYGSLFAGEFLRKKYDNWMMSINVTI